MRFQFFLSIFAGLTALSITACGGSSPTAPPVKVATAQPTVLNLYPNQPSNSAPLLTVMVTSVADLPAQWVYRSAGYRRLPVCQKNIPGITIAASGASVGTFAGDANFDTGTAYEYFSTPTGSSFPDAIQTGSTVTVTMPSGFKYTYTTAGAGTAMTVVDAGANGNSVIGLEYFTTNSFLIDFTSGIEGWK